MLYQAIVNILRNIDTTLNPGGEFFHGNRKAMSQKFGESFPQTHLYPIVTRWDKDNNMVHNIQICFWEQDALSNDLLQTEAIMQTSQNRLVAFIDYLRANNPTISVGEVTMSNEEKTLQATASGYSARFTLTTKKPC